MSTIDPFRTRVQNLDGGTEVGLRGELIYEYSPLVTEVVEYGARADDIFSGRANPPPEGARFDFHLEGPITGPRLKGTVKGVDYIHVRADGRAQLHIHAQIATEDGKKIALAVDGVASAEEGSSVFHLRECVTLTTNHPDLSWLNSLQVWAVGTFDWSTRDVQLKAFAV